MQLSVPYTTLSTHLEPLLAHNIPVFALLCLSRKQVLCEHGMQVAEKLAERGWLPDLIVSSDSTRTKQTLEIMADAHPAFATADTLLRGSLYTVAALDGQTRKHLQVSSTCMLTCSPGKCTRRACFSKLRR